MNRFTRIGLIIFLILLGTVHFMQLQDIPPGLSNDEANIAYEAWSIATTARDQWGNFLPLVFEGFGNWSLPVYIYATTPIVGLLGPTILAARLVSALAYIAIILAVYAILRQLRPRIALPSAAMTAVTPWIYGLTRIATEVPLALALFLLAVNFYLRSRQRSYLIVISLLCLVLAMLTYYGIWMMAIAFAIIIGFRHRHQVKFTKLSTVASGAVLMVGVILLYRTTAVQRGNARFAQVNFTSDQAIVGELNARRGACNITFPNVVCRLGFNKPTLFVTEYFANYLSHFSLRDWFILSANKGILPPTGYFLLIQFPMALGGLWVLLRQGSKLEKDIFVSWLLLAPLADSLTGPGNFARAFTLAPVIPILGAYSFLVFPKLPAIVMGGFFLFSGIRFQLTYMSYFPLFHSIYTHYEYLPVMRQLRGETRPIFISSRYHDTKQYIFYLFYQRIKPREFQQNLTVTKETDINRWVWVKQINNWHFVKALPPVEDLPAESILVGSTKDEIKPFMQNYKMCNGILLGEEEAVTYQNGDPALSIIAISKEGDIQCLK